MARFRRASNELAYWRPLVKSERPLDTQVAIITGAGRGIGAAIARKLGSMGATAVLCGRTRAALENTAQAIAESQGRSEIIACDVTQVNSVEAAARRGESAFWSITPELADSVARCISCRQTPGTRSSTPICGAFSITFVPSRP